MIGHTEMTTDIPEYSHLRPAFYWDRRVRGLGGLAVSCTEENLLDYPGDTAPTGYQLIHEFSHTVHHIGLKTVDPTFDNRLNIAYEAAMEQGLWQGTYSASNRSEYWAQGASWYLNENQKQDNTVNTREELESYDPSLARLLSEIYGDSGWQNTPIATRIHLPHLQGFNPQDSPTFEWSEDLEKAYAQLKDPYSDGGDEWVNLGLYNPSQLSQLNSSRTKGNRTEVLFVNPTEVDVLVYWVHPDGMENFIKRIPAQRKHVEFFGAHAGDIYLVKDSNGKNLAVFQAVEQTGRVLIDAAPIFITPGLSKFAGDNQSSVSGAVLPIPFVVEVRAENGSALAGISVTFAVTAGGGTLNATRTRTNASGRAQSTLTLGPNLGTNTVEVSAAGIGQTVRFTAVAVSAVDIPAPNLRAAVENALRVAQGTPIAPAEMATLTRLEARDANISDLAGLEHATNLREALLERNNISEISPLASLTQLTKLRLGGNSISDISPMAGLTQLTRLSLWGNSISDTSPVKALTNLTELNLSGNSISSIAAVAGLTQLTWLHLQSNRISDISALAGLTNLTAMRLDRNRISDISVLSSLTQLTELRLDRNNITDISPLVANTGLGSGDTVDVRGNPLGHTSIKTHIPALKSRGVMVEFDDVTHLNFGEPRTVRLIYFLPSDRSPQQDIDPKLDTLIREVQQFYANEMERHGFGRKTFTFETDVNGKAVVHHVDGQFTDSYYHQNTSDKVWAELAERFDTPNHIYIVVIDTGIERIGVRDRQVCGDASKMKFFMPGSGPCFSFYVIAHELGHTFGLRHDFRNNAYMLSYGKGRTRDRISKCAAEWLDVHRFFNSSQTFFNRPTTIRMLPPLAYSPKAIRLRFEVTDFDGLHQAQLIIPTTARDPVEGSSIKLHGCKSLSGESNAIEFITTELTVDPTAEVALHVIDVHGNITQQGYSIQLDKVLPDSTNRIPTTLEKVSGDNQHGLSIAPLPNPLVVTVTDQNGIVLEEAAVTFTITAGGGTLSTTRTTTDENGRAQSTLTLGPNLGINTVQVSAAGITVTFNTVAGPGVDIPDPNLRAAIEIALGKAGGEPIAPAEMANLSDLEAKNANITDLTGLEHATNLTELNLSENNISDISPVAGLTQLTKLRLWANSISDISALAGLTNLTELNLSGNSISSIAAVAGLTQLKWLHLQSNRISDIEALAGLTNLIAMRLDRNRISDILALSSLTQLKELRLDRNNITDLSPLVANAGLGSGDTVDVRGNPLSYQSIHTHIPALQSKGVTIEFDKSPDLEMGPNKITGPWLWMIAPTAPGQGGANSNNVDSLAAASNGDVTEAEVAANGAKEGDAVGNYVWALGKIAGAGGNNINDVINAIGMKQGDVNDHSSYALITLKSVTAQSNVTMRVGSDDSIKVWLNGKVVHNNPINRGAGDFQDRFTVNLKQGDNLLLVKVSERDGGWSMFVGIDADVNAVYKRPPDVVVFVDVNRDGVVNILDLILIASELGNAGANLAADVSGDGVVNILDLILAAGMFDGAAAAPSAHPEVPETLTAVEVHQWLTDARALEVRNPITKRGFVVLEQLLVSLTPRETELLANYPNPFNPETWIPYRLAEDAFVTLTIYDGSGRVVRTLDVGHRIASAYESRSKAIYWDGRNELGERVASGVFFYHLSAGDYSAMRKMVILK